MAMHNPLHPGEFITQVYLEPNNLTERPRTGRKTRCGCFNAESHSDGYEPYQP